MIIFVAKGVFYSCVWQSLHLLRHQMSEFLIIQLLFFLPSILVSLLSRLPDFTDSSQQVVFAFCSTGLCSLGGIGYSHIPIYLDILSIISGLKTLGDVQTNWIFWSDIVTPMHHMQNTQRASMHTHRDSYNYTLCMQKKKPHLRLSTASRCNSMFALFDRIHDSPFGLYSGI